MQSSAHASGHPTPATYAKIASILAVITAIEFGIFYVPDYAPGLKSVIVPAFILLSAVKFALVGMFYMHLKFDSRLFSGFFVGGLLLATTVIIALMALFAIVSGERIIVAAPDDTTVDADTTTDTTTGADTTDTPMAAPTHEIASASTDEFVFTADTMTAAAGSEVTVKFTNNAVTQQHKLGAGAGRHKGRRGHRRTGVFDRELDQPRRPQRDCQRQPHQPRGVRPDYLHSAGGGNLPVRVYLPGPQPHHARDL